MMKKAAPKKPAKTKISHVITTKAENGFLNEVHRVPDKGYGYSEPEKHIHDTAESAGNHVAQLMGGKEPDEAC